jgi:hypothetical protein
MPSDITYLEHQQNWSVIGEALHTRSATLDLVRVWA